MKSSISAPEWRSWLRLSITNLSLPSSEHAINQHSAFFVLFCCSPFAQQSSVDNCMRIHKVLKCMSPLFFVPAPWNSPTEPQTFKLWKPEKSQWKAKAIPFIYEYLLSIFLPSSCLCAFACFLSTSWLCIREIHLPGSRHALCLVYINFMNLKQFFCLRVAFIEKSTGKKIEGRDTAGWSWIYSALMSIKPTSGIWAESFFYRLVWA